MRFLRRMGRDTIHGKQMVARGEMTESLYQRLVLNREKLSGMISGVRAVAGAV